MGWETEPRETNQPNVFGYAHKRRYRLQRGAFVVGGSGDLVLLSDVCLIVVDVRYFRGAQTAFALALAKFCLSLAWY